LTGRGNRDILVLTRLRPEKKGGNPMRFLITLQQGEDGFILAECPALPGCMTQGKTRDEVLSNIREAIEVSLSSRRAHALPQIEVTELDIAV